MAKILSEPKRMGYQVRQKGTLLAQASQTETR
jgi:hypothetical protein